MKLDIQNILIILSYTKFTHHNSYWQTLRNYHFGNKYANTFYTENVKVSKTGQRTPLFLLFSYICVTWRSLREEEKEKSFRAEDAGDAEGSVSPRETTRSIPGCVIKEDKEDGEGYENFRYHHQLQLCGLSAASR